MAVELPLLLQFSIALFTGMVAATLVPPVRRAIPKQLELALWMGLVAVCVLGIIGIADPRTRELTSSAVWGVDQIVNTSVGLMLGGVAGWISDNRFPISTWLALLAGVDLVVVALIRSTRRAQGWQPRVRLGEWMEMPSHANFAAEPAPRPEPWAGLDRRLAASRAVARAQVSSSLVALATWMRHAVLTQGAQHLARATEVGRGESRATVESIREATSHLQFAARSWYTAAGVPMVNDLGTKANHAVRRAAAAGKRSAKRGKVLDVQALISAQSIGWYGPMTAGTPLLPPPSEQDVPESQRSDSLAS
jgi:type IV secretory pathway TrbD component